MSDLRADKAIMFQNRHFFKSFLLFVIIIPTLVPYFMWNESLWLAYWTCGVARYCVNLNNAFTINSIGHSIGKRPYDKNMRPADNIFMMIQILGWLLSKTYSIMSELYFFKVTGIIIFTTSFRMTTAHRNGRVGKLTKVSTLCLFSLTFLLCSAGFMIGKLQHQKWLQEESWKLVMEVIGCRMKMHIKMECGGLGDDAIESEDLKELDAKGW